MAAVLLWCYLPQTSNPVNLSHLTWKTNDEMLYFVFRLNLWWSLAGYIQTPSPSDSGVCDIEAMLRDKDAEIQTLRETMANNEAVIFQVKSPHFQQDADARAEPSTMKSWRPCGVMYVSSSWTPPPPTGYPPWPSLSLSCDVITWSRDGW